MTQMVKHETTWGAVRKGDRWPNQDSTPITEVQKFKVWVRCTLLDNYSNTVVRKRLDEPVIVYREELTEQEKQLERNEYMREMLASNLRKMLDDTPHKALTEILKMNDPDAYSVLTSSNLSDVLKTQATYKHALHIRARLTRGSSRPGKGDHVSVEDASLAELVSAYAAWQYETTNRYGLLHHTADPTSRSTSVVSNLIEDLANWAMGNVLKDLQWSGAWDTIQRRVAEFQQQETAAREARNA